MPLPEPPARQTFKTTLRGLGPDPTTGSSSPIPGGSVPSFGLKGMGGTKKTGRAIFAQETDPKSRLYFHYNPSEYNDDESSSWGKDSVANRARPKYTYKQGGARSISFTMLLDEVGQGQPYGRVAKAIKWIRMRMSPSEIQVAAGVPPAKKKFKADIILFIRGERDVFRCHIDKMKVREDMFAPNSTLPVRAWVDITLVQNLEDDELADSIGV